MRTETERAASLDGVRPGNTVRRAVTCLPGRPYTFDGLGELGENGVHIADDAQIGNIEDGSGLLLVDGHDVLAALHA